MSAAGPEPPLSPDRIRTLLVLAPSWVGDTIMATPVLAAVRANLPDARIVAGVRPGLEPLLAGAPWLDAVETVAMKGLLGPLRDGRRLGRHEPNAALLLPNSARSAVLARLTGAAIRVGYDREGRGRLLTHRLSVERTGTPTPAIAYYARLGSFALGRPVEGAPALYVTDDEERAADHLLDGVDGAFVLLNPGANRADKRWPVERFAAVADALAEQRGLRAVATGGPGERGLLDAVVAAGRHPIVDLAARGVDLGSLKAVVRRAAVMITNDTGPRHIAAALGTPLVSLFGPTDHRWTTLACPHERVLLSEPFLPGEIVADRVPAACKIERVPVSDVVFAVSRLLDPNSDTDR
jgi:heptosyltransferase-2